MISFAFFLAAQAVELYLKAFIVSRIGELPKELSGGRHGHDLVSLADNTAQVAGPDDMFSSPAFRETLRRLSPMHVAGRYPRSGHRGPATEITRFLQWLDDFAFRVRCLIPEREQCRDDIELLRDFVPASSPFLSEAVGRGALRELFFAQNRAFGGWFYNEAGERVSVEAIRELEALNRSRRD